MFKLGYSGDIMTRGSELGNLGGTKFVWPIIIQFPSFLTGSINVTIMYGVSYTTPLFIYNVLWTKDESPYAFSAGPPLELGEPTRTINDKSPYIASSEGSFPYAIYCDP